MSPLGDPIPDPDCCNRAQREIEFWEKAAVIALVCLYKVDPAKTARLCDEELDRSGGLLGRIREAGGYQAARGAVLLKDGELPEDSVKRMRGGAAVGGDPE